MFSWRYRCGGRDVGPLTSPRWQCPDTAGALELDGPNDVALTDAGHTTIARYAALLPVDPARFETLGAGMTPLLPAVIAGRNVFLKLDSLLPSGSFKDRGAAVAVAHLAACGVERVIVDSSGNAAAAMAAYCAANRIGCVVYAPASASAAKLVQARAYGATVIPVDGSREAVAEAAQTAAEGDPQAFYASHNWSPVFAEGVKTWAIETWEQLGRTSPDTVFVPTGGGSALAGAQRGFTATAEMPRIVAAQPAACAPLVDALVRGLDVVPAAVPGHTLAEGARISDPPRGAMLLEAVRASRGWGIAVTEAELRDALRELWAQGVYVEPTAALGAAAFARAVREETELGDGAQVVLVTGTGLKATEAVTTLLNG
jgi:threonine synthase